MDRAIVVSADGHASMPQQLWAEYLESEFHQYLPQLIGENELSTKALWLLNDMSLSPEAQAVFDREGLYGAGRWSGLHHDNRGSRISRRS